MCPECGSVREIAVQVSGVYDGALYFLCETCKHAYHRWPSGPLHDAAEPYIVAHNDIGG